MSQKLLPRRGASTLNPAHLPPMIPSPEGPNAFASHILTHPEAGHSIRSGSVCSHSSDAFLLLPDSEGTLLYVPSAALTDLPSPSVASSLADTSSITVFSCAIFSVKFCRVASSVSPSSSRNLGNFSLSSSPRMALDICQIPMHRRPHTSATSKLIRQEASVAHLWGVVESQSPKDGPTQQEPTPEGATCPFSTPAAALFRSRGCRCLPFPQRGVDDGLVS